MAGVTFQPACGNFWEKDLEAYIAGVRERQQNLPKYVSWGARFLRAAAPVTVTALAYLGVLFLLTVPVFFPYDNGAALVAYLVLWDLLTALDMAVLFYALMVGRPPTWRQIATRWRGLHRPSYRW